MPRCEPVLVVGAGGHARELMELLVACDPTGERYTVVGVVTRHPVGSGLLARVGVAAHVGPPSDQAPGALRLLAIGQGGVRRELAADLGGPALSLRHPAATVDPSAVAGEGFVATAGACVGSDVIIGAHVHLNTNSSVGPHSRLDAYVTVSPGASIGAGAVVGEGTFVGVGARVDAGVHVGAECVVGAGAVVCDDVPSATVVAGRPARAR